MALHLCSRAGGSFVANVEVGDFLAKECLGMGGEGVVYRGLHRASGQYFALKFISLANREHEHGLRARAAREFAALDAMRELPGVLRIYRIVDHVILPTVALPHACAPHLMLVMTLADPRSLITRLLSAPPCVPDADARRFVRSAARVLQRVHDEFECAHCDIKPENLLFDADGELVVADWGLVTEYGVPAAYLQRGPFGTQGYQAPEVLDPARPVLDARKADVWALGVTAFRMRLGCFPYHTTYTGGLQATSMLWNIGVGAWDHVAFELAERGVPPPSPRFFQLVLGMLTLDPHARPAMRHVLEHAWLAEGEEPIREHLLTPPASPHGAGDDAAAPCGGAAAAAAAAAGAAAGVGWSPTYVTRGARGGKDAPPPTGRDTPCWGMSLLRTRSAGSAPPSPMCAPASPRAAARVGEEEVGEEEVEVLTHADTVLPACTLLFEEDMSACHVVAHVARVVAGVAGAEVERVARGAAGGGEEGGGGGGVVLRVRLPQPHGSGKPCKAEATLFLLRVPADHPLRRDGAGGGAGGLCLAVQHREADTALFFALRDLLRPQRTPDTPKEEP